MLMPLTGTLEAIIFAAGSEGISSDELSDILQIPVHEVVALCQDLRNSYEERGAGLAIVEVASHWQMVTRPEHADALRRMAAPTTSSTLSAAALEVLAIIAYKQPISRLDIEAIRGVQSDRALSTLVHRQLVKEVGRMEAPGRPILYGTTDTFLQTFGLRALDELPPLPEEPDVPDNLALFQLAPLLPQD